LTYQASLASLSSSRRSDVRRDIDSSINTLVYRANALLKGRLQAALREFDITTEQWLMLAKLDEDEALNQRELATEVTKDQASITRIVDILERKGLAERYPSPVDRRASLVRITRAGRALLKRADPTIAAYHEDLAHRLSREEAAALKAILGKLCSGG
jgi:DNA-binding MarR family transcriptional regulator